MNRRVDPDELVSAADIADIFAVGAPAVSNWLKRHADFPNPVALVARGRTYLWLRSDVVRWYANRYPKGVEGLRKRALALEQLITDIDSREEGADASHV